MPAFGYILGKDGISPNPEDVEAILEALPLKDVKGLQRFLGSVNFFHDFMEDIATIFEPLRMLLKKETKFTWGCGPRRGLQDPQGDDDRENPTPDLRSGS